MLEFKGKLYRHKTNRFYHVISRAADTGRLFQSPTANCRISMKTQSSFIVAMRCAVCSWLWLKKFEAAAKEKRLRNVQS